MIYFDENCKKLKESQGLNLNDQHNAIWFRIEANNDAESFLELIFSAFSSFLCFCWLASSGGSQSKKVLDIKRAFGQLCIPKEDIVARNELHTTNGDKLYSDIALVKESNSTQFINFLKRPLFGVDSSLFFLPKRLQDMSLLKLVKNLEFLIVKRINSNKISQSLNSDELLENYIDHIANLGGISTVLLHDSNMCKYIVIIGNKEPIFNVLNKINEYSIQKVEEDFFSKRLDIGVSLSILS